MCGIAGSIDPNAERAMATVRQLNQAQAHRGPDHSVVARIGGIALGNTRLAIQDPTSSGNQPFVSADGRYTCVFNGEIYNHRELVERFQLPVRTSCDAEVIPHLWAKLGAGSIAELRGMFAVAVVDALEERLYLARDPFGMKPLYWRRLPNRCFVFASEVRPLARLARGARIDAEAVARYLRFGAMAADQSPFLGIAGVPPNSVASVRGDGPVEVRPILPSGPAVMRQQASLGEALAESVDLHLGADVPTALLLSGGVDSAAVASVSRRLGRTLSCLTVATGGAVDETTAAARTARQYGHQFQLVRAAAIEEADVALFVQAMQRPTIDGLNTYLVCRAVRQAGFKVALSGLGGDEAVGGYSHFRLLRYLPMLRAMDALPFPAGGMAVGLAARLRNARQAKAGRLLRKGGPRSALELALLQRELFPAPLVSELTGVGVDRAAAEVPGWLGGRSPGSFAALAAAEVAVYLQPMLLPDADAFSMASSVELRLPFVDGRVFSAALDSARGRRAPGKAAIGAALGDPYLTFLAGQPKRGFSLPMESWLTGPLAPLLTAASEPGAPVWSLVDRTRAERAGMLPLRPHRRWAEPWALAVLNAWLESR
jgi:asparagine synthase (glutamine-hydrolysing)